MKQKLCFGDSNTYGLIPGTAGRYGWNERWTSIVQEHIKDKGYRILEEGLCGRTTVFDDPLRKGRRGSELLPTLLETHNPIELAIIMLGTNDCKTVYDASAGVIGLGAKQLIGQIKTFNPHIKILLVSPIYLGDDVWNGYDPEFSEISVQTSKKLKEVYKKIALDENVYSLAASDYAEASSADREHLDIYGHKALAQAVLEKVKDILNI